LHAGIPALLAGTAVRSLPWLGKLAEQDPDLADSISDESVSRQVRWRIGGGDVDVSGVGCFPPDDEPFPRTPRRRPRDRPALPAAVIEWRLLAWAGAGFTAGLSYTSTAALPRARPSDHAIVADLSSGTGRGTDGGDPVPVGHVLTAAAQLKWAPRRVAERLGELGYTVPKWSWPPTPPDRDDLTLLNRNLDRPPMRFDPEELMRLDPEQPVPVGHVLAAAAQLEWAPGRVAERLGELGYTVPSGSWPPTRPRRHDHPLLSRNLPRKHPWLDPEQPVPAGHVLTAAAQLEWAPGRVAQRLVELGMKLVPGLQVSGTWREGAAAPLWAAPPRGGPRRAGRRGRPRRGPPDPRT